MVAVYVLIGVAAAAMAWAVAAHNALIAARNKVDEAWSGVDVQLKRRHDLVPNLVETVRGYAEQESRTLEGVIRARAEAVVAGDGDMRAGAESGLSAALADVHAVAEDHPDLRSSESFQRLQAELAEIEDEIQAARRIYNGNVEDHNTKIEVFPNRLIAGAFPRREFFEIEVAAERATPRVSFA